MTFIPNLRYTKLQRDYLARLRDAGRLGLAPKGGEWITARSLENFRFASKVDMRVYITELGEMVCKVEGI